MEFLRQSSKVLVLGKRGVFLVDESEFPAEEVKEVSDIPTEKPTIPPGDSD